MPPPNPYVKAATTAATAAAVEDKENGGLQSFEMGPQSQRHLTLKERTHLVKSSSPKKKLMAGDQQTLF